MRAAESDIQMNDQTPKVEQEKRGGKKRQYASYLIIILLHAWIWMRFAKGRKKNARIVHMLDIVCESHFTSLGHGTYTHFSLHVFPFVRVFI